MHYDQKDGAVIPKRVHTVVISVQHDDHVSLEEQKDILREKVGAPPVSLVTSTAGTTLQWQEGGDCPY